MEFNNNQPIYLQIADLLCNNILQKKWLEDSKILSIRDIAVQMEVNPNTVLRTYSFLQDNGIIYNKRGIGYFVTPEGFSKTQTLKRDQFFNQDLPVFFKTIDMLEISIDDVMLFYTKFKKESIDSVTAGSNKNEQF